MWKGIISPKRWNGPQAKLAKPLRPGYGRWKYRQERARHPLFAALPEWTPSPDQFTARAEAGRIRWLREARSQHARNWLRLRQRVQELSDADYTIWRANWRYRPHTPEYGLDLCLQIDRRRGQGDGLEPRGLGFTE